MQISRCVENCRWRKDCSRKIVRNLEISKKKRGDQFLVVRPVITFHFSSIALHPLFEIISLRCSVSSHLSFAKLKMSLHTKFSKYESCHLSARDVDVDSPIPSVVHVRQQRSALYASSRSFVEANPSIKSVSPGQTQNHSSKPWRIDAAKNSFERRQFAIKQKRINILRIPEVAPALTVSTSNSSYDLDDTELDNSWLTKDDEYPSDEENGSGRSSNSSFRSPGTNSPPQNRRGSSAVLKAYRIIYSRQSRY